MKKLVGEVLDRLELFDDFDPRRDYQLTVNDTELTEVERNARHATSPDDIDLDLYLTSEPCLSSTGSTRRSATTSSTPSGGDRSARSRRQAIAPVLAGDHGLFLAPTAGGKTEAASFPVFSKMADENWRPVSVLYLAPLRALLNNLLPRLEMHASYVGRRVGLWHGDTGPGERARMMADPPDLLLTTPESLEAMLISRRVNQRLAVPATSRPSSSTKSTRSPPLTADGTCSPCLNG